MNRNEAFTLYKQMLLIRRFEERCAQLYVEGKIGGFLHLYIGQEAVGVGAMSLLRPDDYIITSYRDHGYALARGTDPRPLLAELCGKVTGISRGKGGSMHFYDVPARQLRRGRDRGRPPARGGGHGLRHPPARAPTRSCLCFFGDGAVNEGAFHEALNVSALWDLPVVYIIENNRYGMGTSLDRASSVKDLYQRGSAYGIPRRDVNGMDLVAVRTVLGEAIDRARKEKRPDPDRGRDLPLPRPLHVRPRQVPHEGGGRGDDEVGPRPASGASGSWSRSASRRPTSTRSDKEILAQMDDAVALRGAEPRPARRSRSTRTSTCARPYIHMKAAEKDPAWRAAVREDRVPEKLPPLGYAAQRRGRPARPEATPAPAPDPATAAAQATAKVGS